MLNKLSVLMKLGKEEVGDQKSRKLMVSPNSQTRSHIASYFRGVYEFHKGRVNSRKLKFKVHLYGFLISRHGFIAILHS